MLEMVLASLIDRLRLNGALSRDDVAALVGDMQGGVTMAVEGLRTSRPALAHDFVAASRSVGALMLRTLDLD